MGPCSWAPTCQPTDTWDLRPGVAVRRVKPIHSWASGRRLGGGGGSTGIVRHTLVESLGHTTWSMGHSPTRRRVAAGRKVGAGIMVLPQATDTRLWPVGETGQRPRVYSCQRSCATGLRLSTVLSMSIVKRPRECVG